MKSKKRKLAIIIAAAVVLVLGIAALVLVRQFKTFTDPYHEKVAAAGFEEKQAQIGGVSFNYAEGPDNGPALLLLHAQHMGWFSFSRVLPELSRDFHVFAVDYHGHGKTSAPPESMNANQIGANLAAFIETVIGGPVFVSGNSSGGVLTAWLAANRPELVKAIVLEDPALFSSEYPRLLDTIADRSFAICSDYLESGENDFLLYWIEGCRAFFKKQLGFNAAPLLTATVNAYKNSNPGKPVELAFLPPTIRLMMRGMGLYDPQFGAAFHEGRWNEGFDHAEALAKIQCPALLLHANFETLEDGTFYGAMDQSEADRAVALIPGAKYMRIDSDHVIHLAQPENFVRILREFFLP
ncbi:MAG: alpha/beta hydrolase [Firmicutes bacterium]|nr:alpha/beta hydrolase [Bacillota bacterium]